MDNVIKLNNWFVIKQTVNPNDKHLSLLPPEIPFRESDKQTQIGNVGRSLFGLDISSFSGGSRDDDLVGDL